MEFMDLRGDWFDDAWIEHGSDLSDNFAFFGQMDGDRYGLWFPDASIETEEAPVVFVGHEGETPVLGRNVVHFLVRLAYDQALFNDIDHQHDLEAYEPFRHDLRAWLFDTVPLSSEEAAALAAEDPAAGLPVPKVWFDEHRTRAYQRAGDDPLLAELRDVLDRVGAARSFRASCLADRVELWPDPEPVPADHAAVVAPLVRRYRAQRAAALPGRGGFYDVWFSQGPEGWMPPEGTFEFPPRFPGAPPATREDYLADLSAFPRTERWMPDWLNDIVR